MANTEKVFWVSMCVILIVGVLGIMITAPGPRPSLKPAPPISDTPTLRQKVEILEHKVDLLEEITGLKPGRGRLVVPDYEKGRKR